MVVYILCTVRLQMLNMLLTFTLKTLTETGLLVQDIKAEPKISLYLLCYVNIHKQYDFQ